MCLWIFLRHLICISTLFPTAILYLTSFFTEVVAFFHRQLELLLLHRPFYFSKIPAPAPHCSFTCNAPLALLSLFQSQNHPCTEPTHCDTGMRKNTGYWLQLYMMHALEATGRQSAAPWPTVQLSEYSQWTSSARQNYLLKRLRLWQGQLCHSPGTTCLSHSQAWLVQKFSNYFAHTICQYSAVMCPYYGKGTF